MRTAAKIFVIIGMIVEIIAGLALFPVGLLAIILALCVGIPALSALSDECNEPSIALSVCTLLFLNIIAGILMLCINEDEKRAAKTYSMRSIYSAPQCEQCGKRDLAVKYYTVNTALGRMNRALCPECKANSDNK